MKTILSLALSFTVLAASAAVAAPLASYKPNAAANNYSIYIDGAELNGTFDTIFFQAKATAGTLLNNNNGNSLGAPRQPGDLFTYPNNMLTASPDDFPGALELTRVGLVNTAQELSYTAGALGGTVTTAGSPGGLFLGNLNFSPGGAGTFQVQLITAGTVVYDSGLQPVPIPEPATFAMAGLGMIGCVAAARRRKA